MPIDDFALFLMHQDYEELVAEEYWQWVTYGQLLAVCIKDPKTDSSMITSEINWLLSQHELAVQVARNEIFINIK